MRAFAWVVLFAVLSIHMGFAGAEEPTTQTAAEAHAKSETNAKVKAEAVAKAKAEVDSTAKAAVEAAVQPPAAQLVDPKKTFKMGDTVQVKIEGKHQITVVNSKATGVWLVLDDVVLKSIGEPTAVRDGVGTALILSFRLSRDPESNDSRIEWKKLLEKQHDGYLMTLPTALAIGTSAALPVSSDELKFYITTKGKVTGTLVVCLVLFGLFYWWLARSKNALRDFPSGPYSLGKSQMAFWGLLVIFTFGGVWFNTGLIEHIPQQVLILLGISGATGLGALVIQDGTKAAELTKLEDKLKTLKEGDFDGRTPIEARLKTLREPPNAIKKGFFQDICDDGNGMSFHRLQTVMWTVILGVIFVSDVAQVMSMPEFPDTLLILMGISNSIYLGFKFPEKP